jgi:HD-GYP domain-containing protein (c-di-GMP phosphodiesterase class II)
MSGYVAATGSLINIKDVYRIPADREYSFQADIDKKLKYRTMSTLVVPMTDHEDQVIGVLQLINALDAADKVVPFDEHYESLIGSLASQAAMAIRNTALLREIKDLFNSLVVYLASWLDARDPTTAGHSRRVTLYCLWLAKEVDKTEQGRLAEIKFPPERLEALKIAGWLHDIGKIGVSERVLTKGAKLDEAQFSALSNRIDFLQLALRYSEMAGLPAARGQKGMTETVLGESLEFFGRVNKSGYLPPEDQENLDKLTKARIRDPLTEKARPILEPNEIEQFSITRGNLTAGEYREIQSHVRYTREILEQLPFKGNLAEVPEFAADHHEKLDGSGYPRNLSGAKVPLEARIMAIADIYDALVAHDRPYKKAMPVERALGIIEEEAERNHLDSDLVKLFIGRKVFKRTEFPKGLE